MKKLILFLILISLLVIASPATAAKRAPVGDRINVLVGTPPSFPAGDPFHIAHGWASELPMDGPVGAYNFKLEVDGAPQGPNYRTRSTVGGNPPYRELLWVFNFPSGMSGTHTFTGRWFMPCQDAVDLGEYPGPCPKPNASVEVLTKSLTVNFP